MTIYHVSFHLEYLACPFWPTWQLVNPFVECSLVFERRLYSVLGLDAVYE